MPLITFSVNTTYANSNDSIPLGMDFDGSYTLTHKLTHPLPPETEYWIKQVSLDGGGLDNSRNKTPTYWISTEFPQLNARIVSRDDFKTSVVAEGGIESHVNDRGTLRFPITIFPVDGRNTATPLNVNAANRFNENLAAGPAYTHRGCHIMNVPLGTLRVDEGFIVCKLTPRDLEGRLATESVGATRLCRLKQMQVILEYK